MKLVIGGSIAIILGVYGLSSNFGAFLGFLAAIIPTALILGGCLTIYLNHDSKSSDVEETTDSEDDVITQEAHSNEDSPGAETEATKTKPEKTEPKEVSTDKPVGDIPKLVGNTGSLVFHSPDCKFSKSEKCTTVFNTREMAIQEGYKPCGICKP